ncbi:uncharacterized protein Tco_0766813 [Tanacetum coccineum]
MQGYTCWDFHGEVKTKSNTSISNCDVEYNNDSNNNNHDNLKMLPNLEGNAAEKNHDQSQQLFVDSETPLYEVCEDFTKLSATYRLMNVKAINGWSDTDNDKDLHACRICGKSRYKRKKDTPLNPDVTNNGQPTKILWYLPIKPRLERLFSNEKDAKLLRWLAEERKIDGKMRHLADSLQWNIDNEFKEFGDEIRNIRYGLSSDGINPFGNMSSRHSTWPVLLCVYNLPPWLCMKQKYIMMSLLIQGPKQPVNDIDIYLKPLIKDMQDIWSKGVEVYDTYKKETFQMRAMIFCTISDFPAYGNLSGYKTKGKMACPVCQDHTHSIWLANCKKPVYMGHRRSLQENHPHRKKRKLFDNNIEWECLQVRHCLDVMHIEKNVCESLIGLLLNIAGKTKDGVNVRNDMEDMGIRPELAAKVIPGKRGTYLPPASYTMSKIEKTKFCQCLHGIKVPSGYSANIKKLVSMKDLKLSGMKSHDCHVLMTQMIPIAIRGILPNHIRHTITKLCLFFNMIHSKVIDPEVLDKWQHDVILTLCQLEMYFPPSFFDVMVHLVSHIVREIKMCGPPSLRNMYPFERYMGYLKGYVRNRSRPEGSIVKGYAAEEVIEFGTNYLRDVRNVGIPQSRHKGRLGGVGTLGRKEEPMHPNDLHEAHFTVLQHMTSIAPYIYEHQSLLKNENSQRDNIWLAKKHNQTFSHWLKEKVRSTLPNVDKPVEELGFGPICSLWFPQIACLVPHFQKCRRPPCGETFVALSLLDKDHFCNTFVLLLFRNGPCQGGKVKQKFSYMEAACTFAKVGTKRAI